MGDAYKNRFFLSALKHGLESGLFVKVKGSYKLSPKAKVKQLGKGGGDLKKPQAPKKGVSVERLRLKQKICSD